MIGKTISHYKIIEKLGEGGMGIVYKAIDTNLERTVALKFLGSELTRDQDARKRLFYEAKAASSLDHPNICSIYEIDETDEGQVFIAMAFYDGESLKDKIAKGPLALEYAINYAKQIAAGLQQAHEKGIVHRDIKSANIIITKEDQVKIMDFGLAKLSGQTRLTITGTTVGTVAYMSPEQARGEKVDYRTDIWSLGVVMYEMLTGQLPFKGDYEQAVLYSILNEQAQSITGLRTGVPIELEKIANKLIAKDPKDRYQHVDEVPVDLKTIELTKTQFSKITITSPVKSKPMNLLRVLPWFLVLLFAILATITLFKLQESISVSVNRVHIVLPDDSPLEPIGKAPLMKAQPALAISPDGSKLVYVDGVSETETQLYLRDMDSYEIVPLEGTEGAYCPFFSPNGEWVGFFANNMLKKVSIAEGTVIRLSEAEMPVGGSWSSDDEIIFSHNQGVTLTLISSAGERIKELNTWSFWPQFLPDSKTVIASSIQPDGVKSISLESGQESYIVPGLYNFPRYISSGHLLCEHNGILVVMEIDLKKRKAGKSIPALDDVRIERHYRAAQYAVSTNGTLVYIEGGYLGLGQLTWVNRSGEEEKLPFPAKDYCEFQISPDQNQIAVTIREIVGTRLFIYDIVSKIITPITREGNAATPVWTPDGEWITYGSDKTGASNIFKKRVFGGDETIQLTNNKDESIFLRPSSWINDGKTLAYTIDNIKQIKIAFYNEQVPNTVIESSFWKNNEHLPVFSPGGNFLGYVSEKDLELNAYVSPFPATGVEYRISPDRGGEPIWSKVTKEIFYFSWGEKTIKFMLVPYTIDPHFQRGEPQFLFEGDYIDLGGRNWDVSQDGQRILLIKPVYKTKPFRHINVVYNWFEGIRQKVKSSK